MYIFSPMLDPMNFFVVGPLIALSYSYASEQPAIRDVCVVLRPIIGPICAIYLCIFGLVVAFPFIFIIGAIINFLFFM